MNTEPTRPWQLGINVWIATGFWVGFVRYMPGTVGALWGVPLADLLSFVTNLWIQALIIVVMVAVGVPICTAAAKKIGRKDPGCVVLDEIATVPIVFLFVPQAQMSSPFVLLLGFLFHRLFDITKPPPCKYLERLPDGLGIMMDDCVAGVYACVALHLVLRMTM